MCSSSTCLQSHLLQRLRQEAYKFQATLSNLVRHHPSPVPYQDFYIAYKPLYYLFIYLVFRDRVSLCCFVACPELAYRPGWPRIYRDPPASSSQVLGLKACATTSRRTSMFLRGHVGMWCFKEVLEVLEPRQDHKKKLRKSVCRVCQIFPRKQFVSQLVSCLVFFLKV